MAATCDVGLSGGRIRYRDSGGDGPPVVFIHGVFVDSAVWRKLESPLTAVGLRFIALDLPLGAHTVAMNKGANMSPMGVAALIGEFLEALDLRDVTLVATDTGGAIVQLLLADGCDRVGRVVLTPCDSFDNFLPLSIRLLQYAARVPGVMAIGVQPLRSRMARRLVYGTLAKHGVPDDITAAWIRPLVTSRGVRRDIARFLATIDHRDTLAAAEKLRMFDKPVLLVWPRRAPYFPFAHAERWVQILPDARLVEVTDAYTFVSEDQPDTLARELASFVAATPAATGTRSKKGTRR
ncbi:alpha/beta fold hydrolase [Mycolicibacterium farcinogenes]|uniref:alpha/beta fold hydrolase n=1 Tax=Mycolicibacterium farcinogenes TaxID=1802 RepID=UPI001FD09D7C|nr:alpha/beta hydrolase [Mycolicibacterium farcinogenes]